VKHLPRPPFTFNNLGCLVISHGFSEGVLRQVFHMVRACWFEASPAVTLAPSSLLR
jgi:hypothetical protein